MLTGLSIRDIVLIEALDLDFSVGLGVLTGETGAGKSILLDSLGLALGSRADSGLVRNGSDKAQVTASFDPPAAGSKLALLLDENEIEQGIGEPLIIRRSVRADGGSKAFINDQPCSAALLREVGTHLVEIHGQHDDRGLLNPRGHKALLDAFGRCDTGKVSKAFTAWQNAKDALAAAKEGIENAARDREYLEHALEELNKFRPQEGEEEELAKQRSDMQKGERIADDLSGILKLFDGSNSGIAQLRSAARKLDRIAPEHETLAEALVALDRAVIEASEAEQKLNAASFSLTFDPQRLEEIEERLFELRGLARKHNVAPDGLLALQLQIAAKLNAIVEGDAGLAKLEAQVAESESAYRQAATALSASRKGAAEKLDLRVAAELAPLKLDAAQFKTEVEVLPEAILSE